MPSAARSGHPIEPPAPIVATFWTSAPNGGLTAYPVDRTTFIGTSRANDIVVQAERVFPRHALVEYHPLTRSFWLRDLQSGQHGGALGYTTRNSRPIYGMVELGSGDTLQFGNSAEFIFEMPALPASKMERSSRSKRRTQTSSSTDRSTDHESVSLPVVSGSRITPKDPRERFVRPTGIGNHRLCHLRNVPRLVDTGKSLSIAAEAKPAAPNRSPVRRSASVNDRNNNEPKKRKPRAAEPAVVPPPSSTPSSERDSNRVDCWSDLGVGIDSNQSAGGSQLVQRIVRLQNELQRRELEMRQLRERLAARENPPLPKINGGTAAPSAQQPPASLTDAMYDTFFSVSSRELEELGRRIGTTSMRDYGDVFNECYRMLQEPFACRLMEINTKCGHIFERMSISTDDRELLYERFDNFFRDRINPISKSLDAFLPVLKDGLFLARQDVRACSLFSTWSREFADQLQLQPQWDRLAYKASGHPPMTNGRSFEVDDLQVRFAEHSLKAHWLPPSLAPLLKILVYEYRNICDEMARKDKEHALSVRRLTDQVAALEMQVDQQQQRLEAQNPRIVADDSAEQEELHFLRDENSTLRTANGSLQQRVDELERAAVRREREAVVPRGSISLPHARPVRSARPQSACGPRTPLDATDDEKPKRPSAPSESDSCSQPSTEEIIEDPDELEEEETDNEYEEEDDEKKEARAPSPPRLEEEHAVRRMEQEETNELELKPPPNSSPDEAEAKIDRQGACESKGVRDARGPPDGGDQEPPPPPAEDHSPGGGDGGGRQKREAGGEDDGGSDDEEKGDDAPLEDPPVEEDDEQQKDHEESPKDEQPEAGTIAEAEEGEQADDFLSQPEDEPREDDDRSTTPMAEEEEDEVEMSDFGDHEADDLHVDHAEGRKITQATDADVDADILDHQDLLSARRASAPDFLPIERNERRQNAIEFWQLAERLASILSVQLPTLVDSDFSSIDADEGVHLEKHRRELACDAILLKLSELLDRIRAAEEQRGLASRQQSVRSTKSTDEERKTRPSFKRAALHHVESIEGESAI